MESARRVFVVRAPVKPSSRLRALAALAAVVALSALAACERSAPAARSAVTDDFGDSVTLAQAPRRIVSLVPNLTEILYAIGAGDRLVGRTSYDRIPAQVT